MEPNLHTKVGGPTFILTFRNSSGQSQAAQDVTVAFNRGTPFGASEFFSVAGHNSGYANSAGTNPFDVQPGGPDVVVESSDPLFPSNQPAPTRCWPTSYN